MKLLLVMAVVAILMSYDSFSATNKGTGVGVMLGDPTGLSMQLRRGEALYDFGLSYDFDDEVVMLADYKKRFPDVFAIPHTALYAGVGAFIDINEHRKHEFVAGVRIPLGAEHLLTNAPLGFFLEIAPTVELITKTDVGFMGAIGGRYYF